MIFKDSADVLHNAAITFFPLVWLIKLFNTSEKKTREEK